jgi:hypothetical protein
VEYPYVTKTKDEVKKRMSRLSDLILCERSECRCEPSDRLVAYLKELNELKAQYPEVWEALCKE